VTELVEKFTITATMHHDRVDTSQVYLGHVNLKHRLQQLWPVLIHLLDAKGKHTLHSMGLTVEVTNLGLEEEAGEGDN
jgi:hypothetical protein